jgi:hypothetical protein
MFGIKKIDSDLVAMKKFFGFKTTEEGAQQTLKEFNDEVKQLTPEDKTEMGNAIRELYGE